MEGTIIWFIIRTDTQFLKWPRVEIQVTLLVYSWDENHQKINADFYDPNPLFQRNITPSISIGKILFCGQKVNNFNDL